MITQLSQSTATLAKTKFSKDRNLTNIHAKFDQLTMERCLFTAWEMMVSNTSPFTAASGNSLDGGNQKSDYYWSPSHARSPAAVTERLWRVFSGCGDADFQQLLSTTAETLQSVIKTSGLCGVDELILEWHGSNTIRQVGAFQEIKTLPLSVCPGKSHENGLKFYVIEARGHRYPEPLSYILEWAGDTHVPAVVLNHAAFNAVRPNLLPGGDMLLFADSWYFKLPFIGQLCELKQGYFSFGIASL